MPRPRHHDDQPRCDECGGWAEWNDPAQQYLCDGCAPEVPEETDEPCEYDEPAPIFPGGFY